MLDKLFRYIFPASQPEDIKRRYNIPNTLDTRIRLTDEGYFVLTCKELPGLITEARDGKELIKMFNDAVLNYYDVPKKVGDMIYNQINIDGQGTFTLNLSDNKVKQYA